MSNSFANWLINLVSKWMQPGAESETAIQNCKQHNINVIAGGVCILQELGYHD